MRDSYAKTNDVDIEGMELTNDQGGAIDVSDLVLKVDLFEDIYSQFMTGTVLISDGVGLRSHFPIVGTETFDFSFRTPGVGGKVENIKLRVVSVTKREVANNRSTETYELKLRSKSFMINETTRVQGSYSGKVSDIVDQILGKYFSDRPRIVGQTDKEYKFTIPNMRISEVMDMLSLHAVSENGDPNFVFYETLGGFVFRSLGEMCKQPSVKSYHNKLSSIEDGGDKHRQEFLKIQDIQIQSDFDMESAIANGALASRLVTHDITTKKISFSGFNYVATFDDYNHMNQNRKVPASSTYGLINNGVNIFMPKSTSNHGDLFDNNQGYEDFVQGNISTRKMWLTNRLLIRTAGDSRLRAGNVATVSMPATEPKKGSNDDKYEDKYASGKYLITSMRHHFLNMGTKEYTNTIEMSRDSLPQSIPDIKTMKLGAGEDRMLTNG